MMTKMHEENIPEITMKNNSTNPDSGDHGLLAGVLIGGVLGLAVGAVATLLVRLFLGTARQLVRKLFGRGDAEKRFDPRWLLQ